MVPSKVRSTLVLGSAHRAPEGKSLSPTDGPDPGLDVWRAGLVSRTRDRGRSRGDFMSPIDRVAGRIVSVF